MNYVTSGTSTLLQNSEPLGLWKSRPTSTRPGCLRDVQRGCVSGVGAVT